MIALIALCQTYNCRIVKILKLAVLLVGRQSLWNIIESHLNSVQCCPCVPKEDSATENQPLIRSAAWEKIAEYRRDTYHLFINCKAAYDSIARVKLNDDMCSFGIPVILIRQIALVRWRWMETYQGLLLPPKVCARRPSLAVSYSTWR